MINSSLKFYRSEAEIQIISASIGFRDELYCEYRLLENYKDKSGDLRRIYYSPVIYLTCTSGFQSLVQHCHNLLPTKHRKENYMSQQSIRDKSLSELADLYNSLVPKSKKITKFRDRKTAIARLTEYFAATPTVAEKKLPPVTDREKQNFAEAMKNKKDADKKIQQQVGKNITLDLKVTSKTNLEESSMMQTEEKKERSNFKGKKIYVLVDRNPRREGTTAHSKFALYKNGMTVTEFKNAGGRTADIAFDVSRGYIKVE